METHLPTCPHFAKSEMRPWHRLGKAPPDGPPAGSRGAASGPLRPARSPAAEPSTRSEEQQIAGSQWRGRDEVAPNFPQPMGAAGKCEGISARARPLHPPASPQRPGPDPAPAPGPDPDPAHLRPAPAPPRPQEEGGEEEAERRLKYRGPAAVPAGAEDTRGEAEQRCPPS